MPVRSYQELVVWQKAMDVVAAVYDATRALPKEEIYGLTSQMRRSAVSIPSNLAEGQGRGSATEFLRFTRMAQGSLQELETQLHLAGRLSYLAQSALDPLLAACDEVSRMLRGLQKSLSQPAEQTNSQLATRNSQQR